MTTLRDIKRRIRSVQSTQKITRAMKLVAAAKLRRAQERIIEARPYAYKMGEILSSLALRADPARHPLLARRTTGRKLVMVVSADKGLCGAFNANVMRRSLDFLRRAEGEPTLSLIVVGRKARDFYRKRPWQIKSEHAGFFDRLAFRHAQSMAQGLIEAYVGEEIDEAWIIYNEFKSVAVQRVKVERLLPIEPLALSPDAPAVDYIYEPGPEELVEVLLPKHVETQIYRILMESLAGEYGARMTAMDAATKNASEMIDALTLQYNKARQERITKELLEVVGGAEALRQAAEG